MLQLIMNLGGQLRVFNTSHQAYAAHGALWTEDLSLEIDALPTRPNCVYADRLDCF